MNRDEGEFWFEQDGGPLVRPFMLTRGRTQADRHALNLITLVLTVRPPSHAVGMGREAEAIVQMCRGRPLSVAEIAAKLDVLLVVAKVLISDLIDEGYLARQTAPTTEVNKPHMELLQAVLDGLCKL